MNTSKPAKTITHPETERKMKYPGYLRLKSKNFQDEDSDGFINASKPNSRNFLVLKGMQSRQEKR